MSEVITVRINFEVNTEQTVRQLTKVVLTAEIAERMLLKTMSLLRQMSGDENLNRFISLTTRAITTVNQLQIASSLLMATNPWLWPLGIMGIAGAAMGMQGFAAADPLAGY